MKKIFLIVLCLLAPFAYGAPPVMLKPSLEAQMAYQAKIDKVNYIEEKKLKNRMRLAEIRARNGANKTKITPPVSPKQVQNPTVSPPSSSYTNPAPKSTIDRIDMTRVRTTWFTWYNDYRASLSLRPYAYDPRLDVTAHDWNIVFARDKGANHHRRNPTDSYYSFSAIDAWFRDRGIDPEIIDRSKHAENVGYGYYSCTLSDCTDTLIASIKSTYNFFLGSKTHHPSLVNPYFTKMGFDIIVVPNEKRYYMTVHYITE